MIMLYHWPYQGQKTNESNEKPEINKRIKVAQSKARVKVYLIIGFSKTKY